MGFALTAAEELREASSENVDCAFVIIYNRFRKKGRWDEEGWGTLWEYCRNIIHSEVTSPGDANEILSNVSAKLQNTFEQKVQVKRPTAYINKIIFNSIAECYRRKAIRSNLAERFLADLMIKTQGASRMSAVSATTDFHEILRELNHLVETDKVKPSKREIFELRFIHGYSIREVAEKLGCTRNAVDTASTGVLELIQESIRRKEAMCKLRHTHS